jgi:hypothetical protein
MTTNLGIVPVYYGPVIMPNDGIKIVMPPSQFAMAELAAMQRPEIEKVIRDLKAGLAEGREDLPFTKKFWEGDFGELKYENDLGLDDLENALSGTVFTEKGEEVFGEEPAPGVIGVKAFCGGYMEYVHAPDAESAPPMPHFDLLSVEVHPGNIGGAREKKTRTSVSIRAPFLQRYGDGGDHRLNPTFMVTSESDVHLGQVAEDLIVPSRTTLIAGRDIAVALRELYLQSHNDSDSRPINGLDELLIKNRGSSIMLYRFTERKKLVVEAAIRRYVFGQSAAEVDKFLIDSGIVHLHYTYLRNSGQLRMELTCSEIDIYSEDEPGQMRKKIVDELKSRGYRSEGACYDFKGTDYQTVALAFSNPHLSREVHVLFDSNDGHKPYFLVRHSHGNFGGEAVADSINTLGGSPFEKAGKLFNYEDDLTGKTRVSIVLDAADVLSAEKDDANILLGLKNGE